MSDWRTIEDHCRGETMSNQEQWLTEAELAELFRTGRMGGYNTRDVPEFKALIAMARELLKQKASAND